MAWDGPHPWITPAEMGKRDSPYVESTARTLTDEGLANSSAKLIPPNSVILSTRAPIGHLVINTVPMAYNQGCRGLVPHDTLDHKFLFYFLGLNVDLLNDLGSGTTFKELSSTRLKCVRMPLPPLSEQKRIVAKLDAAFAAIDTATAHAQQNLASARELFESHLNAVFAQKGEGWVETTLGELCDRMEYGSSAKSLPEGDVPVLRMGNISEGAVDWSDLKFTSDPEEIDQYLLRPGDVLFNRTNSDEHVGKTAIYRGEQPAIFAGYLIRIHHKPNRLDPEFLNMYLNGFRAREYGRTVMSRSVNQANINATKLKSYPIAVPPLSEQKKIALQVSKIAEQRDQLATLYTHKLELLAELKQSILHKAFSGELTAEESSGSYLFPGVVPEQDTRELYAGILAIAYKRHEKRGKLPTFNDIKREKIIHLVEAHCDLSLGRTPCKIAAGPADLDRRDIVESYARDRGYFTVEPAPKGTYMKPGSHFDDLLRSVRKQLGARLAEIEAFIDLFVPMKTRQTEIIATAYSAWNNFLLDGVDPGEEEIIYESRENWHEKKLEITQDEFRIQLNWMRAKGVMPMGRGKRVNPKQEAV